MAGKVSWGIAIPQVFFDGPVKEYLGNGDAPTHFSGHNHVSFWLTSGCCRLSRFGGNDVEPRVGAQDLGDDYRAVGLLVVL